MTTKITVSPNILQLIKKFVGFQARLELRLEEASLPTAVELVAQVEGAQHWMNSTGYLENSFSYHETSLNYYEVTSDVPYARRRDYGFSGMTDALGRTYPDDPGTHYAEAGVAATMPEATSAYMRVVTSVLQEFAALGVR
jgi:hypothetical protein